MKLRVKVLPFVLFAAGLLSQILVSSSSLSTQTTSPVPDFDENGLVDFSDFVAFAGAFGAREGDEEYETKYDLNADGEVGFDDFVKFANSFGEAANRAPVFATTTPVARSVEENTPAGRAVGDPISATDADGDSLTYNLRGLDADGFSIDAVAGQLRTKEGVAYDHEVKDSYSVTVGVSDGQGGSASVDVSIAVTDVDEPHAGPPSQIVVTSGDSALTVRWNASTDETGKPPVSGYEVAHRQGDSGDWQESRILKSRTDTSLTLNGLINDRVYQLRVRTLNGEGASGWSTASGVPVAPKGQDPPPSSQGSNQAPRQGNSPDLVVGTLSVSDSSLDVDDSFTLSATVRNEGSGSSFPTTLRYYRSTDATISDSDTEVGTDAVGILAASGTSDQSIDLTAPSDAGTYYYGACVDAVTGESNSGNNCSGGVQVTISVSPPPNNSPDLLVYALLVSRSPWADLTKPFSFTLNAGIRNGGNGPSATTTLRYYRSTDGTFSDNDTQVGTDDVDGLAANDTGSESIELVSQPSQGKYYIACVDAVTGESNTQNNCNAIQVGATSPPPPPPPTTSPDLAVGTPSVSDSSPAAGGSFTLSATVSNGGDGPSVATTLRYYRSTDGTISDSDTEVGTDAVSILAASGTSDQSIDLTAPSDAGTYYYGACVDAVTGESNSGNNCSGGVQVTVSVSPPPPPPTSPDLAVGTPSVTDSSPAAGGSFTLSATVNNGGDGPSVATTLRYYRSTDGTISDSDTEVGTDAVSILAASGTSDQSIDLTAPSDAGTYYYGACVDAVTGESNSGNNCSGGVQVTVSVSPPPPPPTSPDLAVGTPSVTDSSPAAGGSFTLSATVNNGGDGPSVATTLRYYRSTDGTISDSDTEVGTDAVSILAASGTSDQSIGLTAPSDAGTYYYGACVDAVTGESNSGNNCSSGAQVTISVSPPPNNSPDLLVYALLVSRSPWADLTKPFSFTLNAGIRNGGNGPSATTTLRYYRSTDGTFSDNDTQVGTDDVDGLAANDTGSESIELVSQPSQGKYYIACVDAVTGESNTQNNCSSIQVGATSGN